MFKNDERWYRTVYVYIYIYIFLVHYTFQNYDVTVKSSIGNRRHWSIKKRKKGEVEEEERRKDVTMGTRTENETDEERRKGISHDDALRVIYKVMSKNGIKESITIGRTIRNRALSMEKWGRGKRVFPLLLSSPRILCTILITLFALKY